MMPFQVPVAGSNFMGRGRVWLAGVAVVVQVDYGLLGFRAPQSERGAAVVDGQFKIIAAVYGPGNELSVVGAVGLRGYWRGTQQDCCHSECF